MHLAANLEQWKPVAGGMHGTDRDIGPFQGIGPDALMVGILGHHIVEVVGHHPGVGRCAVGGVETIGRGEQGDLVTLGHERPHRLGHPDLGAPVQVRVFYEADVHQVASNGGA